ncbi:MAG TPA: hypothetical protein VI564_08680 [Candidatus Nanoarchaeia archaeon]|nr:hypothetical protein [Candidatus Nanoarchaeia archaeon]
MRNQKIELGWFSISEDVKQVLLGSLLGDGCLEKGSKNAGFSCCHNLKQKEYFFWKVDILKQYFKVNYSYRKNGEKYFIYRLRTNYSEILTELHNLIYIKSKLPRRKWLKIINLDFLENLDKLGLAVWYCDDGTYCVRDKSCSIATLGFTQKENLLIKEYFLKKWNISAKVIKEIKKYRNEYRTYYKLTFNKNETEKFLNLMKNFVPKSMVYKLGHYSQKNKELMESEDKRYKTIRKEWYYTNHNKALNRAKKYRESHRVIINKKRVDYYWNNPQKSRQSGRESMRKRRVLNKEKVNIINKDYYHRNKDRINKQRRERLLKYHDYKERKNENGINGILKEN